MTDDDIFRCVLLTAFVLILPIGFYHRLKASTSEKLDRRQEGILLLVSIRLIAFFGMLGLLLYMIDPTWMTWAAAPLPRWLRWSGVGVGFIGACLLTWTFRNLGKNITDTVVTRKEHFLVTTGPYRWVRHPFYLSFAICMLANTLVTANWFVFASGSVVLVLLIIRTAKEEENLLSRFGDDYRNYMKKTGRFLPRLKTAGERRA
jgi:protein-S-isoprenylcysteine O-methyltransferase Ste14